MTPGMVDITWKETVEHKGGPFRVSLTYESDANYDHFVLLDHIQHNDQGSVDGHGKYYRVKVEIPDINCAKCALQLIQVATDMFPNGVYSCENPTGLVGSCGKVGNV